MKSVVNANVLVIRYAALNDRAVPQSQGLKCLYQPLIHLGHDRKPRSALILRTGQATLVDLLWLSVILFPAPTPA